MTVCPVDCIHPRPGEPDYGHTEMLYVEASVCIDCGACADACPVKAIKPADTLVGDELVFLDVNAGYYENRPAGIPNLEHTWDLMGPARTGPPLRVAIVGTGPSASYTARSLVLSTDSEVTVLDRAVVSGGFVRAAVAPDHAGTKHFSSTFDWIYQHPRTRVYMNVTVGKDITHEELLEYHDAVIYGVGADQDRELGVPGEGLPGVFAAHQLVRWYNADDFAQFEGVTLEAGRAVIVGNGNVALDIARILLTDPAELARTEISAEALEAIREASIDEVVILGRRGPCFAAFTRPELLMMPSGVEVLIASDPLTEAELAEADPGSKAALLSALARTNLDLDAASSAGRRVVLVFGAHVERFAGADRVEQAVISWRGKSIPVAASTVIRSIGQRGSPIPGLPFDESTRTVPHRAGRVVDGSAGEAVPGAYVVGWIKRGAHGGIGVNRADAHETIQSLLSDAGARADRPRIKSARAFKRFVKRKAPFRVSLGAMRRLERTERLRGSQQGLPRRKWSAE